MPRRPVTINIAPSRWQQGASWGLALALCLLVARYGPPWLTASAVLSFWLALRHERRRSVPWQLRWVPGREGGWQVRAEDSDDWRVASLRYDYLGPWLIGLKVNGRRHWLWPDSAPFEERQALRRVLLWEITQELA